MNLFIKNIYNISLPKYTFYHINNGIFKMEINKDNLTIIIVTIKSESVIENCLDSIHPEIKKIIIENSSNQNFFKNLISKYKNIECFAAGKNYGMGKGNNIGIKKSKTRYVMILNPDTILKADTLEKIFEISKNLDFSILSPISDNIDYPNYKIKKVSKNINDELLEVDSVDGYAMIFDTTKFEQNYFDENFFMYLENDDLCLRMKKKNEKIYVYKKAFISHLGAKAVNEKYQEELEFSRNWHWNWSKFYFRKKHYGFIYAFLTGFPNYLKSCLKFLIYFLINEKFKFKIYFNRASGFYNSLLNKKAWYRPKFN